MLQTLNCSWDFPQILRYLLMFKRCSSIGFSTCGLRLSRFWWPVTLQIFSAFTSFLLSIVTDAGQREFFVYHFSKRAVFEVVQ